MTEKIQPPKYINRIVFTLREHGHSAYLVGGCVRDILLSTRPHDWDICTSALPEEVMAIFPRSIPTGIKHGTVTVRLGSQSAEVTTYRTEGSYSDHRRPESVSFVHDIESDLSRRDFTVNAMALSPDGEMIDPFGGRADLARGIIRCVGDAQLRFEEDALRMLRALRFSARLGFEIDTETLAAIREKAPLAVYLTAERVRDELEKTLMSAAPECVFDMASLGLLDKFIGTAPKECKTFERIARIAKKPLPRWTAFAHLLFTQGCIASPAAFLSALRLDSHSIRCASDASRFLSLPAPASRGAWKRALNIYGDEALGCACRCRDAIYGGQSLRELNSIIKSGECYTVKELDIDGEALLALGYRGQELGREFARLLEYVMDKPADNKNALLLELARADRYDRE